jgi:hypothetical protein
MAEAVVPEVMLGALIDPLGDLLGHLSEQHRLTTLPAFQQGSGEEELRRVQCEIR